MVVKILYYLGRPIYLIILNFLGWTLSLIFALFIILKSLLNWARNLPIFSSNKSHPRFAIPIFAPKLKKPPRIKFTSIRLPKVSYSLPSLRLNPLFLVLLLLISFSTTYLYYKIFYQLPSPDDLVNRSQKLTTQILDRNGQLLFKIYQDENRTLVNLSDLPLYVKQAFIAIEDKDFYHHQGFSISGIIRAFKRNLFDHTTEGGSTITQQLVKNTLLSPEKTWERKTKELILALKTESRFDKDTILQMYINEVGFGGPAYGIQEAAQQYFNVNANELTLAQAAFLAGLPKAPSKFSPYINPQHAFSRQKLVLTKMYEQNYINKDELDQALSAKLIFAVPKIEIKAPHFVMYVRDLLVDRYGEPLVSRGGLKVTTTLDLNLQNFVQEQVNSEVSRLSSYKVSNGSSLITRPKTGEILAMVGSKNYFDINHDGQVNLTTSLRQPGSSVKPINYALALENGYTPDSRITDAPISIRISQSEVWTPRNYDGRFHGQITLRQALANSYNIPAIMILAKNGVNNMANLARQMGITTWDDPSRLGLSLTLGSVEVKMTDMAQAYGTFANYGSTVKLNPILRIEDNQGHQLPFSPCDITTLDSKEAQKTVVNCQSTPVLSPETAYIVSDILSDNIARSAAFGTNSVLNIKDHKVAVKTGTSNDLRDNWTFGYTPDYLVATWVGNNDNSPMSQIASGITGASPIWHKVMTHLLETSPNNTPFTTPDNLVKVYICTLTGTLSCAGCPSRQEYFIKGTEPTSTCTPEDIEALFKQRQSPHPTDRILDGLSIDSANTNTRTP